MCGTDGKLSDARWPRTTFRRASRVLHVIYRLKHVRLETGLRVVDDALDLGDPSEQDLVQPTIMVASTSGSGSTLEGDHNKRQQRRANHEKKRNGVEHRR